MDFPVVIVNFKTYNRATGPRALELAKKLDGIEGNIVICAQTADIRLLADNVSTPVFAQHIDDIIPGSHTGWILPESIKDAGAVGVLLNHSEHKLDNEAIIRRIVRVRDLGLEIVVCARSQQRVKELVALGIKPNAIAVEPPELIGGDVSVSEAEPQVISESVAEANGVPILCGAGIKTKEDVGKAMELGARGVLVASGVAKSDDPARALSDMIEGTK
jgi:triosephosphate isomerase